MTPAIWRTMRSSFSCPSPPSAMISRRRRMIMRSEVSLGSGLGSSRRTTMKSPIIPPGYDGLQKHHKVRSSARNSIAVEAVCRMQRAHRELGIGRIDQYTYFYLGRRDRMDVDPLFGKGLEHLRCNTGVTAHADADYRYLDHVCRAFDLEMADIGCGLFQDVERPRQLGGLHSEGHVGVLAV